MLDRDRISRFFSEYPVLGILLVSIFIGVWISQSYQSVLTGLSGSAFTFVSLLAIQWARNNDRIIELAAFSLFIFTIFTFVREGISAEFLTAFATVALAVVTMEYVSLTSKLVEIEEGKKSERIERSLIQNVISPTIGSLERNSRKIGNDEYLKWSASDCIRPGWLHIPNHSLERISRRNDTERGRMEQFREYHPELFDEMVEHDEKLAELKLEASNLLSTIKFDVLPEYDKGSEVPDVILNGILSGTGSISHTHTHYEEWKRHHDPLREVTEQIMGEELEEFAYAQNEYVRFNRNLVDKLAKRRKELKKEHGIE